MAHVVAVGVVTRLNRRRCRRRRVVRLLLPAATTATTTTTTTMRPRVVRYYLLLLIRNNRNSRSLFFCLETALELHWKLQWEYVISVRHVTMFCASNTFVKKTGNQKHFLCTMVGPDRRSRHRTRL